MKVLLQRMRLLLGYKFGIDSFDPENCDQETEYVLSSRCSVRSLTVSNDGVRIAYAVADTVLVKNLVDDSQIALEKLWRGYSWRLLFNNQGSRLLTIDNRKNIKCWDLVEATCLWSKEYQDIHCVQWSSDDLQLISLREGDHAGTGALLMTLWDSSNGNFTEIFTLDDKASCSSGRFGAMRNDLAASICGDSINIYDIKLRTRIHEISCKDEMLAECCFSPSTMYFACASETYSVRVFVVSEWTLLHQIKFAACDLFGFSLRLTCDDNYVAVGSSSPQLYDITTGKLISTIQKSITAMAFGPSPPQVVLM